MSNSVFGRNLKYYRSVLGMTQEDVAKTMGVTRGSIANYETGRSEPEFAFVCKAASVLGVTIDELFADQLREDYIAKVLITDDERGLLQAYREADPVYQGIALEILRAHRRQ